MALIQVSIKKYRNRFFIYAGENYRLSQGFKTQEEAITEYNDRKDIYDYEANSPASSIANTKPVVVKLNA